MSAPRPQEIDRKQRLEVLDGASLRRAFIGGAAELAEQADAIDAINVFPVPDGDTGTNMSSTMRAATAELSGDDSAPAYDVAQSVARGALMGAKGNSGVILSQILAGFAAMPAECAAMDAREIAAALERGRAAAYRVVSEPKEGTILTAITASARAAEDAAASGTTAADVLTAAVDAAGDAVARTPELLPVLKEAGVVDSGAQGLYVMLRGMLRGATGDAGAETRAFDLGHIDEAWLSATRRVHGEDGSGYCTEFVVEGLGLDPNQMRQALREMGSSVLVVGGSDLVRVHLHTEQPDDAFAYARQFGELSREKVDDLGQQAASLAQRIGSDGALTPELAVVAVAAGDGMEQVLRSIGASAIVRGGQTMNPSAGELRKAIDSTGAAHVIMLPNNKNIVMAARQAAEAAKADVRVVPTTSIPQGVAALVALNVDAPLDENADSMEAARGAVRTAEITRAVRETRVNGIEVSIGQPIGMIDGTLAVAAASVPNAVLECVSKMVDGRDSALVTLYYGEGEDDTSASALASRIGDELSCEVEVIDGGQPHYAYIVGVE